jgi:hypothetical protein
MESTLYVKYPLCEVPCILVRLKKLNFFRKLLKYNLHENPCSRRRFHADGKTDIRMDGPTDRDKQTAMTNLIVSFRNTEKAQIEVRDNH